MPGIANSSCLLYRLPLISPPIEEIQHLKKEKGIKGRKIKRGRRRTVEKRKKRRRWEIKRKERRVGWKDDWRALICEIISDHNN